MEVRSIAYVTAINLLIIACGFSLQWRRERSPSLRDWAIGFGIGAVGCELSALRGVAPDILTALLANMLMHTIYVFIYIGVQRQFSDAPAHRIWFIPAAATLLYLWYVVIDPQPTAWPVITGYVRVVLCIAILRLLRRHRDRMSAYSATLLQASAVAMGLFMFSRASLSPWIPFSSDFNSSNAPAITYFVTAACTLAMMFGLVSLYVDQLLGKLEHAANVDVLTGLYNRRRFDELARIELARAQRNGDELWLLTVDIDHFKRINDSFGHDVGDQVLRETGQAMRHALRSYDVVARYGGEEFCILLPATGAIAAQATAQRLSELVRSIKAGPEANHAVSISVGAAALRKADQRLEDLVKRADTALYQAKCSGRDRVVGFELSALAQH